MPTWIQKVNPKATNGRSEDRRGGQLLWICSRTGIVSSSSVSLGCAYVPKSINNLSKMRPKSIKLVPRSTSGGSLEAGGPKGLLGSRWAKRQLLGETIFLEIDDL